MAIGDDLLARAARVRMLVVDVDGTLTDGRLSYGPDGEAGKQFHVRDGYGMRRLQAAGVLVGVISGRSSPAVAARMRELGVELLAQGVDDKLALLQDWLARQALALDQVCYVGDDVPDLPVLRRVGLAVAVADAHPAVLAVAHGHTALPGGRGAVREVCELLLRAHGVPVG